VLTWDFSNWDNSTTQFLSTLNFQVDTFANIGDRICFEVKITPTVGDADSLNNTKNYCFNVVNSYDPNDKQVYPQGVCKENYTLKDKPLTYTVRFQNTGNAEAIDIYILDTLSTYLNPNSVRVIGGSHKPLITEVLNNNILKFRFDNINLPDSTSNLKGSQGYVTYEVSPYIGLNNETVINNGAAIYFDFNKPVLTNKTKNTLTDVLPTVSTKTLTAATSSTYSLNGQRYTAAGRYTQYLYTANGCDSAIVLNLSIITGLQEMGNQTLNIYPNPFANYFDIALDNTSSKNADIALYTVTGQKLNLRF